MALELRPNCEHCDADLPPWSTAAMICSYECTFCASCVEQVLHDVCPNCGGSFTPRPIRPRTAWRAGLSLADQPASDRRRHAGFDADEFADFRGRIEQLSPSER